MNKFSTPAVGALFVLLTGTVACADTRLALESVDGHAKIELSCHVSKSLGLAVIGHRPPPIVSPADPTSGLAKRGTVRYTFDGQGPVIEQWLPRDDGVTPSDPAQLHSFARRLFLQHVLFVGLNGMKSFEFQLDDHAAKLGTFAEACVNRP